jgi:glycosyltransferase involved in cell wall biosynthesis
MTRPDSDAQRIVFNGRFLAQVQTGVQRYAAETLVALDALLSESPELGRGLRFELVVPEDAAPLELHNITTVRIGGRGSHVWEQLSLWRAARGAYLVNFNYSGPLLKRRQLVTIHDATVPVMPQAFSRSYRWLHHTLVAILGRSADSVMTISNFSRDEIARCFGLRRRDVVVGCEGGEHAVHGVDDHTVLQKHGLSPRAYALGVGSVKPNKNFGLIGQAMKLLPNYPWPVAIAGAKDIGIFRDASVLPDGFRFLGFVPDEDLSALYRQAACFVFPSSYEGFGLPAVEAMANGCPVLAANAASIPEVCGDAALYFDADDAIGLARAMHRMHEEPALRETLVRAGYERLRQYNWPANARILLNHLKQRVVDRQPHARLRASEPVHDSAAASPRHSTGMHATSPSPKILHATECLAAGTMNFLIQATRELAEAGVQQTLLYSRRPDTPEDFASRFDARVTLIELPPLRTGVLRYFRSLRRHLLDARLDKQLVAMHLHSSKAGFLGRMALAGTGRPFSTGACGSQGSCFMRSSGLPPASIARWWDAAAVKPRCWRAFRRALSRCLKTPWTTAFFRFSASPLRQAHRRHHPWS